MAFVLGFFTSFGWWTAGKVQKAIDSDITKSVETKSVETKSVETKSVEIQQDKKE